MKSGSVKEATLVSTGTEEPKAAERGMLREDSDESSDEDMEPSSWLSQTAKPSLSVRMKSSIVAILGRICRSAFPPPLIDKLQSWDATLDRLLKEANDAGAFQPHIKIIQQLPTPHVEIPRVGVWCKELQELGATKPRFQTLCLLEGGGGMGKSTCALDLALRLQGRRVSFPASDVVRAIALRSQATMSTWCLLNLCRFDGINIPLLLQASIVMYTSILHSHNTLLVTAPMSFWCNCMPMQDLQRFLGAATLLKSVILRLAQLEGRLPSCVHRKTC